MFTISSRSSSSGLWRHDRRDPRCLGSFEHLDRVQIGAGTFGSRLCVATAREKGARLGQEFEETGMVCACENGDWEILTGGSGLSVAGEGCMNPWRYLRKRCFV